MAKSETTNENRKLGASCELLKIASVTAEHYMTCSNTIQGQQKIKLGAFQEAPEIYHITELGIRQNGVCII